MMSNIGSDVPGGTGEREFGARIRAHFARNTIDQRVWTQTGHFVDFGSIECPDVDVSVIIVNPGIQDDGVVTVSRRGSDIIVNTHGLVADFPINLTLFDASGRQMGAQQLQLPITVIDAGKQLPRGMYFLRLTENGRLLKTIKAVL